MKKICLVLLIAFLFIGCASVPSDRTIEKEIANFELPMLPADGESIVYVVRPTAAGTVIPFKVYIDERKVESFVGQTKGKQYIYFPITPGEHSILSKAENTAEYSITVEPGQIYFLQQTVKMGLLIARNNLQLIDDNVGTYWVKNLKPGHME